MRLAGAIMPDIVPSARAAVTVGPPAREDVENMSDSEDTDLEEEDVPPASEDAETADDEEPLVGVAGCGYPARHPHRSTLIYCIFYLLGMGTLLPWNFFITADSYWNYKFRDVHNSTVPTDLQYNFFGYLSVASMVPNTIFLTLNAVFGHKMKQQAKLVASLSLVIVFFIITTVLVPIDSDDWQNTFFAVTMVMVVILNAGAAVFQGGLFGLAAQFPARYLSAVISGQALGAVFACVARIVSIAVSAGGDDPDSAAVNSALVYFILADVTLVISVAAYIWMSRMSFYEYYTRASRLTSDTDEDSMARPGSSQQAPTISVWKIFLKIKWYALSVCLVFVVTLALFPAVTAKIIPQDGADYSTWTHDYFVPVCCFLLFNGCDYIGRILGGFTVWPKMNHWYLVLGFTLLRFAFFPLFMHCDNGDKQQLTVVFDEDWYYIVFMVVFGLSNGYLSTLCMIYGPSLVEPEEQNTASSMMAAFLGLGLCGGALLSNLAISLL